MKEFVLKNGLLLSIILIAFNLSNFIFEFTLFQKIIILGLVWFIVYLFFHFYYILNLKKVFKNLSFKELFTSLFKLSAISILIFIAFKACFWGVVFEDKYFDNKLNFSIQIIDFSEDIMKKSYEEAETDSERKIIGEQLELLNNSKANINKEFVEAKSQGVKLFSFIGSYFSSLFFAILINAILALVFKNPIEE